MKVDVKTIDNRKKGDIELVTDWMNGKIVISEAVERCASDSNIKYALGSVLNHVLLHQTIIGLEAITYTFWMTLILSASLMQDPKDMKSLATTWSLNSLTR